MKKNKTFNISLIALIVIIAILVVNSIFTKEGNLIKIDYQELLQMTENKEDFVLIVSQSTCSHCATYKPKMKTITKEYGIDAYYIDYDMESKNNQDEFLEKFNLTGATPITLFFENGKEKSLLNRIEGDLSSTKILEKLKKMGFID